MRKADFGCDGLKYCGHAVLYKKRLCRNAKMADDKDERKSVYILQNGAPYHAFKERILNEGTCLFPYLTKLFP
jgi:hypothetical protein